MSAKHTFGGQSGYTLTIGYKTTGYKHISSLISKMGLQLIRCGINILDGKGIKAYFSVIYKIVLQCLQVPVLWYYYLMAVWAFTVSADSPWYPLYITPKNKTSPSVDSTAVPKGTSPCAIRTILQLDCELRHESETQILPKQDQH